MTETVRVREAVSILGLVVSHVGLNGKKLKAGEEYVAETFRNVTEQRGAEAAYLRFEVEAHRDKRDRACSDYFKMHPVTH